MVVSKSVGQTQSFNLRTVFAIYGRHGFAKRTARPPLTFTRVGAFMYADCLHKRPNAANVYKLTTGQVSVLVIPPIF